MVGIMEYCVDGKVERGMVGLDGNCGIMCGW